MNRKCSECRYVVGTAAAGDRVSLVCYRYPPGSGAYQAMLMPDVRNPNGSVGTVNYSTRPVVRENDWCGEFVPLTSIK